MPCRVGITTDPSERKRHWEREVVGLKNWRQQHVGSKLAAQTEESRRHNFCKNFEPSRGVCHAHPGGGDPDEYGWHVYEFDYSR